MAGSLALKGASKIELFLFKNSGITCYSFAKKKLLFSAIGFQFPECKSKYKCPNHKQQREEKKLHINESKINGKKPFSVSILRLILLYCHMYTWMFLKIVASMCLVKGLLVG